MNRANRTIRVAIVALCLSALIGLPALAERPSINMLNAAVNQLQAEVNQLQAENDAQQAQLDVLAPGALRVFDATGSELGVFVGAQLSPSKLEIYHVPTGVVFAVDLSARLESPPLTSVFYGGAGCTAPMYIPPDHHGGFLLRSAEGHVAIENGVPFGDIFVQGQISTPGGECLPVNREIGLVPLRLIDLGLSFPLSRPVYIGLPPE